MLPHHYAILGLPPDADARHVHTRWRQVAKAWHPDHHGPSRRFEAAREAWDTLKDPAQRAAYDTLLQQGIDTAMARHTEVHGLQKFGALLAQLTGYKRATPPPTRDRHFDLSLPLPEAIQGGPRTLDIQRIAPCASCLKSGAAPEGRPFACLRCGGVGETPAPGLLRPHWQVCSDCRGRGWQVDLSCAPCQGAGIYLQTQRLELTLPPNLPSGGSFRVVGQGDLHPFAPPGDLLLHITVPPHPHFERRGPDLHTDLRLPFWRALTGGPISIQTLAGPRTITIPPHTRPEDILRLPGFGATPEGALRLRIQISWPEDLSPEARHALSAWADQHIPPAPGPFLGENPSRKTDKNPHIA